jgi:hypothetical protein
MTSNPAAVINLPPDFSLLAFNVFAKLLPAPNLGEGLKAQH